MAAPQNQLCLQALEACSGCMCTTLHCAFLTYWCSLLVKNCLAEATFGNLGV